MENKRQLIYVDDAKRAIEHADPAFSYVINNVPLADAVEVVHGRWLIDDNALFEEEGCCRLVCSVCGRIVHNVENPKKAIEYRPYCHCGAKMDGDENA